MPFNFENQIIAVTGGSGDIGGAACDKLDAAGACVVILDRDVKRGEAQLAKLKHPKSRFIETDVSSSSAVGAAFEQIDREYGRVDGLVNSAGIAKVIGCLDPDDDLWHRTIQINLSGVHFCSQQAARE